MSDHLLDRLKANNRAWSEGKLSADPGFFKRLERQQAPEYLWIGCSDSRVPANEIVGLDPGDPARCDTRLRRELIEPLAEPPAFVAIDVDGRDPEEAAAAHDVVARGIDLAILGLGTNGRVGFNEPGSNSRGVPRCSSEGQGQKTPCCRSTFS